MFFRLLENVYIGVFYQISRNNFHCLPSIASYIYCYIDFKFSICNSIAALFPSISYKKNDHKEGKSNFNFLCQKPRGNTHILLYNKGSGSGDGLKNTFGYCFDHLFASDVNMT